MNLLRAFFRPARAVPVTTWSAEHPMTFRPPLLSLMFLLAGLWMFGTGHAVLIAAGLGVSPWTTLAQGVAAQTGWTIGFSVLAIGVLVLVAWIPMREWPGLGTILNVVLVAVAIDTTVPHLPVPDSQVFGLLQSAIGVILLAVGSAFYLTANLGPGPRDGLMTGLQRLTKLPIGWVRTGLEVTVLTAGWLLGGVIGIATLMVALGVGPLLARCLSVVDTIGGAPGTGSERGG